MPAFFKAAILLVQSSAVSKTVYFTQPLPVTPNRTQVESLARSYTKSAIRTVAGIMLEESCPPAPMARVAAAKVLLDRGWGKPKEMHDIQTGDGETVTKVVNEFVHVYRTPVDIAATDGEEPLLIEWNEVRSTNGNGSE